MTYLYDRGKVLPKIKVETRLIASLRNRSISNSHPIGRAVLVLIFICCLFHAAAVAQSQQIAEAATEVGEIKPLQIGDTIPQELWSMPLQVVNHPEGKDTITLNDYRDKKLIILDFWATWCSNCIKNFPKLDTLQKEIGETVMQIVLVNSKSTRDNIGNTKLFFDKKQYLPNLLSVTEDTVFKELFPHRTIPHYVWLRDGRLLAATKAEDLTRGNIQKALAGDAVNSSRVPQISLDIRKPLFDSGNGGQAPVPIYKSTLTPFVNGLKSAFATDVDAFGGYTRLVFTNSPIINLFTYAYPAFQFLSPGRLILDVEDKRPFRPEPSMKWKSTHLYTYEARFPPTTEINAKILMQADLHRYFKYDIRDTIVEQVCLVARKVDLNIYKVHDLTRSTNQTESGEMGIYFQDYVLDTFFEQIEVAHRIPVVDEIGMEDRSMLRLPIDLSDMSLVNSALKRYGVEFSTEKRRIPVVIISDKKVEK